MIKHIFALAERMSLWCFLLSVSPVNFNFNYSIKRLGFANTEARGSFYIDDRRQRGSSLIRVHNKTERPTSVCMCVCIHTFVYTQQHLS